MGPRQGSLRRLAAALVAAAVTLGLVELALRLAVPPSASQVLRGLHRAVPDKPWLYELVPGERRRDPVSGVEYAVSPAGFRDRARDRAKPDGTFRIAVIGDSLTFGYGVALDATFSSLIEQRLVSSRGVAAYEVLNLGVSGYNPYTEAELLRGVGLDFAPDLVLVQFCVNDLNDPTLHFDASTMLALGAIPDAAFPDRERSPVREPAMPGPLSGLCDASRLCTLLTAALQPGRPPEEMIAALKPHDDPSEGELRWLEALYARMARDVRARGGELVLVVFPYQTQLEPGAGDALQQKLRTVGERAGITVIDLLPAFRRAASAADTGALFLDMWHPTARGHRVAADELFRALACARLLPGVVARCDQGAG